MWQKCANGWNRESYLSLRVDNQKKDNSDEVSKSNLLNNRHSIIYSLSLFVVELCLSLITNQSPSDGK